MSVPYQTRRFLKKILKSLPQKAEDPDSFKLCEFSLLQFFESESGYELLGESGSRSEAGSSKTQVETQQLLRRISKLREKSPALQRKLLSLQNMIPDLLSFLGVIFAFLDLGPDSNPDPQPPKH